eukprot:CAMPEP_0170651908 /NCGR_PEP_ID=MMETSP0224-20130122/46616_1 /TAXON_ID=285029 /ORGANISM="Togula jolla, Strain CCCM 725" /LENGTH=73 /DNA_ID=CAMNT_0010983727 /DNA_START=325 /DNA_END=542 /DNA_ORIENTATION=+
MKLHRHGLRQRVPNAISGVVAAEVRANVRMAGAHASIASDLSETSLDAARRKVSIRPRYPQLLQLLLSMILST